MHGLPDEPFVVPPQFGEAITLAPRVRVPTAVGEIEVEVVAVPRADGSACLVDAFLDPARDPRPALGDPVFLDGLRLALARLGFPAGSLVYADEVAQDEHCVALEAGADLARALLDLIDAAGEGSERAAAPWASHITFSGLAGSATSTRISAKVAPHVDGAVTHAKRNPSSNPLECA